ncbi:RNA-splicing factor [Actinomortierella ambigua]|nr:RNA-splicing factor [Actinomortierella ambigua]
MGGGDLNLKKSWHPGTFRNQEKVWKQERRAAEEEKKLQQLRKELEEERQIQELQRIQEAAGGKKRQDRLDWMYQAPPTGSNKDEAALEDYLLGKKRVDDILNKKADDMAKLSREADILAKGGSSKANNPRDIQAKIREDPLLAIKRREQAALEAIARNPIKLRQMQEGKDGSGSSSKKKFKKSKSDKKNKDDRHKSKKEQAENGQDKDAKEAQAAEKARRLQAMMDDAAKEEQLRKERLADVRAIEARQEAEEEAKRADASKGGKASFLKHAERAAFDRSLSDRIQRGRFARE